MQKIMMIEKTLRNSATFISAIYIGFFLTGLISYFGSKFHPIPGSVIALTYLTYAIGLVLFAFIFVYVSELRLFIIKAIGIACIGLVPLFVNNASIDGVAKSYIVGIGSLLIFSVVSTVADRKILGWYCASLVCVISFFCLFDACFYDGFTNTRGRSAALFVNPNIAAIVVLVAAVGSIWAVPVRFRLAFIVLVGGAVLSTLSRSAMLLCVIALLASLPLLKASNLKEHFKGLRFALATVALVTTLLGGAYANNKSFGLAIESSLQGLIVADSVWTKAQSNIKQKVEEASESTSPVSSSQHSIVEALPSAQKASTEVLEGVEKENSAVARAVLLQRALAEYRTGHKFGSGLERAFELGPHNSYVLFAVAFGFLGWLIVPLFAGVIFVSSNWQRSLPSVALILGVAFFSHDLFTSIPIISAITVVVSGLICQKRYAGLCQGDSGRYGLIAAVVAMTLVSVISMFFVQALTSSTWSVPLQSKNIGVYAEDAYYSPLNQPEFSGLIRIEPRKNGGPLVTENGRTLGSCVSEVQEIVSFGNGRCQYDNLGLLFSTADNSSPLENGRSYQFLAHLAIHPLYIMMIIVQLLWSAILLVSVYRLNYSEGK